MQEHNKGILSQAGTQVLGVCRDFTGVTLMGKEKVQALLKNWEHLTSGDIILADLSQYIMIDKGGLQSASSIHFKFTTDETAFRFVFRVDGQPWWSTALIPFKGSSNTLSPFVVLS